MKKILLAVAVICGSFAAAQNLPTNPEPGKCYVRCTTPDVYVNETETVIIKPSYTILKQIPATFKQVTERVLVKEESKKFTIIPEQWADEEVSYVAKTGGNTIAIAPATFVGGTKTVEVKPAYAQWELGAAAPDCASGNPDDCRYWCYVGYPAQFENIDIEEMSRDASISKTAIASRNATYTKRVLVSPARVEETVIPAVYEEITKTVVDRDAYTVEETVPAVTETVTKEILQQKGGLTEWREVECALKEYTALPINWNLNSATLTPEAKRLIDSRLLPVLAQNPGVKLEVASHTDARGSDSNNQVLSEARARAVVTYLTTKGVNPSLLVANGYGEERLKNRCADGVSCTEREHAVNRRTEFRLIGN
jgi:outer membrane protein OmpA-like peptidoglycan-associated protein